MQQAHWLFNGIIDVSSTMTQQQMVHWSELKQFYKQHMPYSKPTRKDLIAIIRVQGCNLCHSGKSEVIAREVKGKDKMGHNNAEDIIAAVIRIKPIGQQQLVTGLVVASEYRGCGLAHTLLEFISKDLKNEQCFVFALPHLTQLYQEHGFNEVKQVTNDIQQLYLKHHSPQKPLVLMQLQSHKTSFTTKNHWC